MQLSSLTRRSRAFVWRETCSTSAVFRSLDRSTQASPKKEEVPILGHTRNSKQETPTSYREVGIASHSTSWKVAGGFRYLVSHHDHTQHSTHSLYVLIHVGGDLEGQQVCEDVVFRIYRELQDKSGQVNTYMLSTLAFISTYIHAQVDSICEETHANLGKVGSCNVPEVDGAGRQTGQERVSFSSATKTVYQTIPPCCLCLVYCHRVEQRHGSVWFFIPRH